MALYVALIVRLADAEGLALKVVLMLKVGVTVGLILAVMVAVTVSPAHSTFTSSTAGITG